MAPRRHVSIFVAAALGVLAAGTVLLTSSYRETRSLRASRHRESAAALAASGDLQGAIVEYRAALSLERADLETERALALTLLSLGRTAEAESYFGNLLQRDPSSGPLNRGMARIHASRGEQAEARVFYQRAVYGEWPGDPLEARISTRFELIDYLAARGAAAEALSELLRLRTEIRASDTVAARRVAMLFVAFGDAGSAIAVLRAAVSEAPRDVGLLADLADAELESGAAAEARATLRRALAVEPDRADLRDRLAVIDRVLALDPTLPRLRLVTRTRRARQVLGAVLEQTRGCLAEVSGQPGELAAEAAERLRRRAQADAEAAEDDLELAARMWAASPGCQGNSPEAVALAQVLERVQVMELASP
jgi:tetratricopeptide (TPR) repeat protein